MTGMELDTIYQGNALEVLRTFPVKSIDMCMTSPPYWGLRDYGIGNIIWGGKEGCKHKWDIKDHKDTRGVEGSGLCGRIPYKEGEARLNYQEGFCQKCGAWKGQLGLEPTPELYIKHLCDIFDETWRVLKDCGSLWVNLSDTYSSTPVGRFTGGGKEFIGRDMSGIETSGSIDKTKSGVPAKSLVGIPERFVLEMMNRGWTRRNTIIWFKPNCMPSSAKDRFTVDFEYLYFFTKKKKYYFEQQLEEWTDKRKSDIDRALDGTYRYEGKHKEGYDKASSRNDHLNAHATGQPIGDPLKGRNKRCLWRITLQPFKKAHFAVFPEELCETPIRATCPRQVCKKCGKDRKKIYEKVEVGRSKSNTKYDTKKDSAGRLAEKREAYRKMGLEHPPPPKFKGWSDCGCNAGFRPGICLDPFFGSGTLGVVARRLGRNFVGIELNPVYIEIAKEQIKNVQKSLEAF